MEPTASKFVATAKMPLMVTLSYYLAIHKWTAVQVLSTFISASVLTDLPEGIAGMGMLTFVFACWKQWEEMRLKKRELRMKEEWHRERIETVKMIRANELNIDPAVLKEILGEGD